MSSDCFICPTNSPELFFIYCIKWQRKVVNPHIQEAGTSKNFNWSEYLAIDQLFGAPFLSTSKPKVFSQSLGNPPPRPCIVPFFSACLSQFSIRWRCWVSYQMKRRRTMLGQARTSSCVWRALRRRRSCLALSCVMLRTCATRGALSTPRSV